MPCDNSLNMEIYVHQLKTDKTIYLHIHPLQSEIDIIGIVD